MNDVKRTMLLASLIVMAHAAAARAQSTVYLGGDLFLDMQRGSGATAPREARVDTNGGGGGVRVGTFLASRWSLEIGVDASAAADSVLSLGPDDRSSVTAFGDGLSSVVSSSPVLVTFDERLRTQVTATSVLLGYHPPARGRVRAGFKGGIGLLRSSSTLTSTTTYTITDPRLAPLLTVPTPISTTSSSIFFSTVATMAAEAAFAITSHAEVVPEVRAFGSDGRLFIRPGVEVRWLF
jgi:hypothetical protein